MTGPALHAISLLQFAHARGAKAHPSGAHIRDLLRQYFNPEPLLPLSTNGTTPLFTYVSSHNSPLIRSLSLCISHSFPSAGCRLSVRKCASLIFYVTEYKKGEKVGKSLTMLLFNSKAIRNVRSLVYYILSNFFLVPDACILIMQPRQNQRERPDVNLSILLLSEVIIFALNLQKRSKRLTCQC